MPQPSASALAKAALELIDEERENPGGRDDLRFVLAVYAATAEIGAAGAPEIARIAHLPESTAAKWLGEYQEAGILALHLQGPPDPPRYRFAESAFEEAATMVEALSLALSRAPATAPAPPQARPRAPPGWQWMFLSPRSIMPT